MKRTMRILVTVMALWAFGCEEAGAEPGLDTGTLNSPCDEQDNAAKVLALQVATIAGQQGTASQATVDDLLETVKGMALNVQNLLVQCWSAETAYNASMMANMGSPGAAETTRYQSAVGVLKTNVASLPTKSPGETELDRSLNSTLGAFYGNTVSSLNGTENLRSVKGLQDRIREAYADVVKASIDCRIATRRDGSADCTAISDKLDLYGFKITARVLDARPKVVNLTTQMKANIADSQYAGSLAQQYMGALQNTIMQIQGTMGYIQSLAWWANYHLGMYYYCVAWANYFAAVGNWGGYYAYAGAAQSYAGAFWYLVGYAIPYYQYVVKVLQGQAMAYQNAIPGLQQRAMSGMQMADRLKGLIIALPVAQLED